MYFLAFFTTSGVVHSRCASRNRMTKAGSRLEYSRSTQPTLVLQKRSSHRMSVFENASIVVA